MGSDRYKGINEILSLYRSDYLTKDSGFADIDDAIDGDGHCDVQEGYDGLMYKVDMDVG